MDDCGLSEAFAGSRKSRRKNHVTSYIKVVYSIISSDNFRDSCLLFSRPACTTAEFVFRKEIQQQINRQSTLTLEQANYS